MFDFALIAAIGAKDLRSATARAAENEKVATHVLLTHLAEVDARRLYADWGHSSLHVYVRDELKFSAHQAYERASAARLLRKVPEVATALEAGSHTLTSVAQLSSHLARERATVSEATALVARCKNLTTREIERVLIENSAQVIPNPDRVRAVSAELTRLTLEVDAEFMALYERTKELAGIPGATMRDVFASAMREYTKRREVRVPKPASSANDLASKFGAPQKSTRSRYVPVAERRKVRIRANDRCEYVDPESRRRCKSRTGLEVDHFPVPFARGGESVAENLRFLCFTHNALHATQVYGRTRMELYRRRGF